MLFRVVGLLLYHIELTYRIPTSAGLVALKDVPCPPGIWMMIDDHDFGGQALGVFQRLLRIRHLVETQLEIHDIRFSRDRQYIGYLYLEFLCKAFSANRLVELRCRLFVYIDG